MRWWSRVERKKKTTIFHFVGSCDDHESFRKDDFVILWAHRDAGQTQKPRRNV